MIDLKSITPAWWGAIAGAVVAGASLFPNARIVGGLGAGAAMFFLAKKMSGPCCAECAQQAEVTTRPEGRPMNGIPAFFSAPLASSGAGAAGECLSCGGLDVEEPAPTAPTTKPAPTSPTTPLPTAPTTPVFTESLLPLPLGSVPRWGVLS